MTDYLARLGYDVRDDADGARVHFAGRSALFGGLAAAEVRRAINDAMEATVPYFAANVAKSEVAIEPRRVEKASFRVVVSWLTMYNNWRRLYPEHRNHPLAVGAEELSHPQTFDKC